MDAEDTEEPYSGETLFEHYYENVSDRSELSKRTVRTNILQDQSAFFSLITRLNVPILDRSSNQSGGQDHLFVGAGASFGVTRALLALPELHNHTINKTKGDTGKLPEALKTRRYVTKRIAPRISATVNEAQTLAAITNEVRILANRTLKDTNHLVRLLGVAWDEVPTYGRFWPRILLEAADYGTLGEFLAKCPDASDFSVKIQLLCGVAAGLQSLHQHGVAHCDLKLENVLVFRAEKTDDESLDYIYQAKICDFGFSVILTDYDKDSTFAERVGTEPWTSPELTFGSPVKITDLPKADIYSYGLLLARVFMEGGNPFERLSIEETREIKRERQDNSLVLHRHLTEAIFARVAYPKLQSLLIQKLLLVTLVQQPDARFPLHLIGEELVLLGLTLGGIQTEKDGTGSEDVNTSSQATPDSPNEARTEITKADSVLSFPNTLSYVIRGLKLSLLACLFLVNMIKGLASLGTKLVLRKALKWTGRLDVDEPFHRPSTIDIEPIQRLISGSPSAGDAEKLQMFDDIPNFEDLSKFSPIALSPSVATEIVQSLIELADNSTRGARSAEAAYQLAIASFEGIGMPKDFVMCLKWLENAALRGSKKAVMALPNVTASLGGAMSSEAQAAVRSRLPEIAKEELLMSVSHIFTGRIPNRDEFPASRLWKELDSGPFEEHMASDEFHVLKGLCLAICLITHGVEREDELFDFAHLEGYRARSLTKFDPSDKDAFIRSVRKHDCLKAVGVEKLTVLQLAAATGDLELTRTLVLDLRADVNDYGITPRLTPLWISCFFGNMEVAAFLAEHGADAGCRDDIANRTILHFANQCHTEEDLHRLLQIAGSASLGLDVQDGSGNTPLLSTFIGWDFSNGLASRALLSKKAFSLFRSNTGWDSLCAAVVTLNYGLVKDIVDSCSLLSSEPLRRNKLSINEAKATAFGALFSMSEFYRRRIDGSKGSSTLGQIVDLLLDDGSIAALKKMDFAKDTNPLIAACFMGFEDLSSAILDSPHCPPINGHDDNNSMTALHWAMQRGRESTVMRLLERGADPLLKDNEGLNAFHHAARFSPELLDIIVAKMDKGELPKPEGMHMKDIISTPAANGETSFAIAVTEGSVQHLELAEKLRTKYELDHDTPSIKRGGSKMTLMAYMIRNATISNVFTLEQIEYVLNIDPRPKFVADTSNSTLLHYAVAHWHHAEIASNPVGFAVLRLLLRTFPDRKYLDMVNDGGYSAMHYAALHSNIQALEIIHDHLLATNQVFDPNCSANNGPPTLHVVGKIEENVNMKEEDEPALFTILRRKTAQTYEFLRGHGAYYAHEREPVTVCNLACTQNMLSLVYLRCFLEIIQERTGFAWEIKSEDSNIPPELEGTNQAAFVVELCWVRDRFILKAMQILTQDLEHHCMERERVSFRLTHGDTKFPWTRLEYEDTIHGHIVRWRRPGKLWTEEEVNLLKKKIVGAWAAIFDDSYVARPGQVTTSSPE